MNATLKHQSSRPNQQGQVFSHNSVEFRRKTARYQRIYQREQYLAMGDIELVDLVKGGEKEAFGELVRRYKTKVNNLALKITKNENDAQEVVQDVCLSAFAKLDSFKGTAAFSSWLYRVTANSALMLLRSRKRDNHDVWDHTGSREPSTILTGTTDWTVCADRVFERKEIVDILGKEFQMIPERYRTILVLREVDGLSNRELSEVLGISVAAVKSRLHRARLALRKRLTNYYGENL